MAGEGKDLRGVKSLRVGGEVMTDNEKIKKCWKCI